MEGYKNDCNQVIVRYSCTECNWLVLGVLRRRRCMMSIKAIRGSFAAHNLPIRHLAWLVATMMAIVAPSRALPAPSDASDQPPIFKSIPDRVKAVRERFAIESEKGGDLVPGPLYRLTQF